MTTLGNAAATRPLPPGPHGWGARGLLQEARTQPAETFLQVFRTYGDVVRAGVGGLITYYLAFHPDAVEQVLAHGHKNYRKGIVNAQFRVLDGDGLVTSEGDLWVRQRRLAQPAFHRQRLDGLAARMTECAERLVGRWSGAARGGRVLDVEPEFMATTLEIAGLTLFGVSLGSDTRDVSHAVDIAREYITWRMYRPFFPTWLPTPRQRAFTRAKATLDQVVYGIIAERRRTGAETGDLLSMLMAARDEETGEGMSDLQLRDEVMTLMMAGYESTAVALTWAVYLLARHPNAQARVQAEADRLPSDRPLSAGDLAELPYTRAAFEETLRLYPPAWALSRQAIADDELGGYRIPANGYVTLSPYVTHRHPEFWPEPERFDPERFLSPSDRHRYAYFPFGAGPRRCIGFQFALMEAQIVLASLFRRYAVTLASPEHPGTEALLSLRPRAGVKVRLTERSP